MYAQKYRKIFLESHAGWSREENRVQGETYFPSNMTNAVLIQEHQDEFQVVDEETTADGKELVHLLCFAPSAALELQSTSEPSKTRNASSAHYICPKTKLPKLRQLHAYELGYGVGDQPGNKAVVVGIKIKDDADVESKSPNAFRPAIFVAVVDMNCGKKACPYDDERVQRIWQAMAREALIVVWGGCAKSFLLVQSKDVVAFEGSTGGAAYQRIAKDLQDEFEQRAFGWRQFFSNPGLKLTDKIRSFLYETNSIELQFNGVVNLRWEKFAGHPS